VKDGRIKTKNMARTKNNAITANFHGKVGDQFVIRQRGRTSVLAALPEKSKRPASPAVKAQRKRFAEAVKFAKELLADPEKRKFYESRATPEVNALNLAMKDYMAKKRLESITE
jgi:hypothetical protein